MLFSLFDTETTGFTSKHRILEIGIVQLNDKGEVVREFETLINPERDIANSHVHGITPGMDEVRLPTDEYRRDAEDICDEEIANGTALILKQNISLPAEDLVRETARLFGFKQLGSKVKNRMETGLALLIESGRCSEEGGRVSCGAVVR